MKKRSKRAAAVLCGALLLGLAGCSLAQPERQGPEQDRFVGFHMVYERMYGEGEEIPLDRSQWIEYGRENIKVDGMGTLAFPRMILVGQFDEETQTYDFPGLEGLNCFLAVQELEGDGKYYTGHQGLADAHIKVGDEEESLSGTVYFGPPLDDRNWNTEDFDYGWRAYQVYQMPDGAVYLDGTGNSFGGVGGFTTSVREEYTTAVDGKAPEKQAMEVSVSMESVERMAQIRVKWFDGADQVCSERTLVPEEVGDGLTLDPPAEAAWALVEETDTSGSLTRTAYSLGRGEGASHRLVLLDGQGVGRVACLTLEEPEAAR